MPKNINSSPAKVFVKKTAHKTWGTAVWVALLFGGIALAVSSFQGPPAGCTPTNCPANPLKVDFMNGAVKIGDTGQTKQLCLNGDCKSSWPAGGASPTPISADQIAIGNLVWDKVDQKLNGANMTYDQAMTYCAGRGMYLPTIEDWHKAKGIKGSAENLKTALGLNNYYRSSTLTSIRYQDTESNAYNYSDGFGILNFTDGSNYFVGDYVPVRCVKNLTIGEAAASASTTPTGLRGMLWPLRGKTISCGDSSIGGSASVDANGNLILGARSVTGPATSCTNKSLCSSSSVTTQIAPIGIIVGGSEGAICSAEWPAS